MMRKLLSILVLLSVCLTVGGGVALADGMILPLPEGVGSDYLVVRYHHVTVQIAADRAVTRVEQQFHNPHGVTVTGRYLFPIPPEAVLSHFVAEVDGQRQVVSRQDRETTNAQLQQSIVRQNDPSLLRYADWESLAFELALAPGSTRTMYLEYEEVLAPSGGLYRYRYVLSTERYSSLPLEAVSITVELSASPGLASLYSPTHDVATERLGPGRARVRWEAWEVNPSTDFELFFSRAEGGYGGGLLTSPSTDGQGHFLFLFAPEMTPPAGAKMPKDIVLVLDRSGSMAGAKIEQAQAALQFILDQLGQEDRFSLVSFSDHVSTLSPQLRPAGGQALRDARRYVGRMVAGGSTDLEAALQAALQILDRSEGRGAPRLVVFLTDGLPTAGITDEATIAERVAEANLRLEARLHVFGVGYDVNTHLLDRLAADAGGTVTYVQPEENLEVRLTDFYGTIAHPLLTDLEIAFDGLEASSLYPRALPDLFQGSALLLSGRYRAAEDQITIRVRGRSGDEMREVVYRLDLAETDASRLGDTDFVARLWATRRIGALLDQVRVSGESEVLVAEIRELGLRHGIVTPYTSFAIQAQDTGAASAANMDLYGRVDLNAAWGETTVQARVQNQIYQQAAQADLAAGANVSNYGQHSLAQVGEQQVDLSLLEGPHLDAPLTDAWLERNVQVDRTVDFGSEEYFRLAADPDARLFLQSGTSVVFAYGGQVVAVRGAEDDGLALGGVPMPVQAPAHVGLRSATGESPGWLALPGLPVLLLASAGAILVAGSAGLAAVAYWLGKSRK